MKKHPQTIVLVILALLLAGWMGRRYIRNWFPPTMQFASVALAPIDSNHTVNINDFKGNVLIVSCYQTWCTDCARETPVLNELATTINSGQFKVIYVSDEPVEKAKAFHQRFPSDKIVFMKASKSMAELGVHAYPTTFLIDKDGGVIKTTLEGYDWMKEEATIKKLLQD